MKDLMLNPKSGKIVLDESRAAHLEDLLRSDLGHFKHAPIFGSGAKRALHGDKIKDAAQRLKIQAQAMKIYIKDLQKKQGQWHIKT